jgi:hypothetical protein
VGDDRIVDGDIIVRRHRLDQGQDVFNELLHEALSFNEKGLKATCMRSRIILNIIKVPFDFQVDF